MTHKDLEKKREADRRWRAKNPEKSRETDRHWRAENPEKKREAERRWRAAKRSLARMRSFIALQKGLSDVLAEVRE